MAKRKRESQWVALRATKEAGPPSFRIRKRQNTSEEGGEHSWAVSYVDLLMVLMSFFIMFFSIDGGKKVEMMERLSTAFRSAGMGNNLKGTGTAATDKNGKVGMGAGGPMTGKSDAEQPPMIKELSKELKARDPRLRVSVSPLDPKGMMIDLPDDIFNAGEYRPNWRIINELDRLMNIIKPYESTIRLVFVGHTDDVPIIPGKKNAIIATNLVLSDLRAAYSAGVIVEKGIDPSRISTQGFAEFGRGTRSVSLHIFERASK